MNSAISQECVHLIEKVKTQILFSLFLLHNNIIESPNFSIFSRVYATNLFSFFSIVSYQPIFSIYSRDLSKLTAQIIFGVPGSKRKGSHAGEYSCSLTRLIAQPQPIQLCNFFNNSFLP